VPARASFFDGVPGNEVEDLLAHLRRRRFPAGAVVLSSGETPPGLYLVRSGTADVFLADRHGVEHRVGTVGPGTTLGEIELLTGQPTVATVRARSAVEALILSEADFERIASRFPQVYRNLGAILSQRLRRTGRLAVEETAGRVTVLLDWGAPPLLAYALASSVAWHMRGPALLLVVGSTPPERLATLAGTSPEPPARAELMLAPPVGRFAPSSLPATVEELRVRYEHVFVQQDGERAAPLLGARAVHLLRPEAPPLDASDEPLHAIRGWVSGAAAFRANREGVLEVPPLTPADEAALADGLLSATTAAGRALGWAARDLAGLKVGVALSAGGAKGYAHIGALRALEQTGVPLDYLAGTSVGAAIGALQALGYAPAEMAASLERIAATLFRPTVPRRALLSSAPLARALRAIAGDLLIEDLPLPLAVVATDVLGPREVVFRRGLLWLAVLASISMPGIYPPQRVGRYVLVDGGVLNPVPSDTVAEMGADKVIAILVRGETITVDAQAEALQGSGPLPSVVEVLVRSTELMQSKITNEGAAAATIVIAPEFKELPERSLRRFAHGRRYIEDGAAAVEAALPRMAAALPWLGS
jgi:NTE family protein